MVPVLDINKTPLIPCSEKRARLLMERGQAKAYYQKSIFCIMLLKEPSNRKFQEVALGIDPGSKREGYTVLTKKNVVLNVLTNTPYWVKDHVEARRTMRRNRRSRKTPYRACRENRATLRSARVPPSTKARWNAKLRITKQLLRILPITHINVEDVQATTKKGKRQWNASFSPLEVGKAWFYDEIGRLGSLALTRGFDTKAQRDDRGFLKIKAKLEDVWEAHNVDSHALAEIALSSEVLPFKGMYRINFLEYHRRQLHKKKFDKGGIRASYGSTVSLGMSRGSILRHKEKGLVYLGGTSNGKVSIHDIISGERLTQHCKTSDIEAVHITKERTQFLRHHKDGGILAKKDDEKLVNDFLRANNIEFLPQKLLKEIVNIDTGRIRPDFYLPKANMIIEYNGRQHYENRCFGGVSKEEGQKVLEVQQKRDQYLQQICLENNIALFWIDGRIYKIQKLKDYLQEILLPIILEKLQSTAA